MPIKLPEGLRRLSESELNQLAYDAMRVAFDVHNEFGRLFDEQVYETEIARRLGNARTQVPLEIWFENFRKKYYLDLLYADSIVFELKAAETTTERHRAQLMNYLLIMEIPHGKLVNLRPESVAHEFVNAPLKRADRVNFQIVESGYKPGGDSNWKDWFVALLRDSGSSLEVALYEEALTHYLGGEERVLQVVDVVSGAVAIGRQEFRLLAPDTIFKITAFESEQRHYQHQLERLLKHTPLRYLQWINVGRKTVTFRTLVNEH